MEKILGIGGGRKVIDLGNGTVKKIAINQNGIEQNMIEDKVSNSCMPQKNINFNPVLESTEDYTEIICPYVNVFKTEKEFFNEVGLTYDELDEYAKYGLEYVEILYDDGEIELETYDLFTQVETLVVQAGISRDELGVFTHWGRDLQGNLVIVDYGKV